MSHERVGRYAKVVRSSCRQRIWSHPEQCSSNPSQVEAKADLVVGASQRILIHTVWTRRIYVRHPPTRVRKLGRQIPCSRDKVLQRRPHARPQINLTRFTCDVFPRKGRHHNPRGMIIMTAIVLVPVRETRFNCDVSPWKGPP